MMNPEVLESCLTFCGFGLRVVGSDNLIVKVGVVLVQKPPIAVLPIDLNVLILHAKSLPMILS